MNAIPNNQDGKVLKRKLHKDIPNVVDKLSEVLKTAEQNDISSVNEVESRIQTISENIDSKEIEIKEIEGKNKLLVEIDEKITLIQELLEDESDEKTRNILYASIEELNLEKNTLNHSKDILDNVARIDQLHKDLKSLDIQKKILDKVFIYLKRKQKQLDIYGLENRTVLVKDQTNELKESYENEKESLEHEKEAFTQEQNQKIEEKQKIVNDLDEKIIKLELRNMQNLPIYDKFILDKKESQDIIMQLEKELASYNFDYDKKIDDLKNEFHKKLFDATTNSEKDKSIIQKGVEFLGGSNSLLLDTRKLDEQKKVDEENETKKRRNEIHNRMLGGFDYQGHYKTLAGIFNSDFDVNTLTKLKDQLGSFTKEMELMSPEEAKAFIKNGGFVVIEGPRRDGEKEYIKNRYSKYVAQEYMSNTKIQTQSNEIKNRENKKERLENDKKSFVELKSLFDSMKDKLPEYIRGTEWGKEGVDNVINAMSQTLFFFQKLIQGGFINDAKKGEKSQLGEWIEKVKLELKGLEGTQDNKKEADDCIDTILQPLFDSDFGGSVNNKDIAEKCYNYLYARNQSRLGSHDQQRKFFIDFSNLENKNMEYQKIEQIVKELGTLFFGMNDGDIRDFEIKYKNKLRELRSVENDFLTTPIVTLTKK